MEKERNIKKRGTIKWTSLMLSEHIEMLKEVWKEDERVKKGLIAEDKAVEIDFLIRRALNDSLPVRVCYFIGDSLREESVKVTAVDATDKKIKVIELTYKYECMVDIHAITDIEIL